MTDEVDAATKRLELTDQPGTVVGSSRLPALRRRRAETGRREQLEIADPSLVYLGHECTPYGAGLGNSMYERFRHQNLLGEKPGQCRLRVL
jgi:hypothetical protein